MLRTTAIRFVILSIASMSVFGVTQTVSGQIAPLVTSAIAQQPDPLSQTSNVNVLLESTSRMGGLTYVPGRWGEFHLSIENTGDSSEELLCTSYFDSEKLSAIQYGRRVWLPNQS